MKKYLNLVLPAILLVLVLCLSSCQKEDALEKQVDTEHSFDANSDTAKLIARIATNDGSHDNIIDGSSCINIVFPYQVVVNGEELTISSTEDFETIETIFDRVHDDEDQLEIMFPITITTTNYTEITIEEKEELSSLSLQCVEGGSDDDIECVDILYPVDLYVYNDGSQETKNVTVTSDKDLSRFFVGLNKSDLISLNYPVEFQLYDGTELSVSSNTELATTILQVIGDCDEDDDNDFSDDDFTVDGLEHALLECTMNLDWLLNGTLSQSSYSGFSIEFNEDGMVKAVDRNGILNTGEWMVHWGDNRPILRLNFNDILELNKDWYVNEIQDGEIKLFTNDEMFMAIINRNCDQELFICDEIFVHESFISCNWPIVESSDQNQFLLDLTFKFYDTEMQIFTREGEVVDQGVWSINANNVMLSQLSNEMQGYNGSWQIVECASDRIKIENEESYLILQKKCD